MNSADDIMTVRLLISEGTIKNLKNSGVWIVVILLLSSSGFAEIFELIFL